MTTQKVEELYIRSFDEGLSVGEQEFIANALKSDARQAAEMEQYSNIRKICLRKTPATFGPYFAQKVIAKIQNVGVQIDRQIFAYFKKYQLVALGIVMALLAFNAMLADQVNLQTIFGLENTTPITDEIVSFDFNELMNK